MKAIVGSIYVWALLTVNTVTDLKSRTVWWPLCAAGIAAGTADRLAAAGCFGAPFPDGFLRALYGSGILQGLLPGVLLLLCGFISRGGVGAGDGLTLMSIGAAAGAAAAAQVMAAALGLVFAAAAGMLLLRRADLKTQLPFMPFLLGAWILRSLTGLLS